MIQLGFTNPAALKPFEPPPTVTQAIAETAAWCSLRGSLASNLRSCEIDPSAELEPRLWSGQVPIEAWVRDKYCQYGRAVEELKRRRSERLSSLNVDALARGDGALAQGRILIYFPMETVTCGASAASSRGFFDEDDAPPWDTWFWYADGAIFSLVSEDFVSQAQAGIDANPVDCIHWAESRELSRLTEWDHLSNAADNV